MIYITIDDLNINNRRSINSSAIDKQHAEHSTFLVYKRPVEEVVSRIAESTWYADSKILDQTSFIRR